MKNIREREREGERAREKRERERERESILTVFKQYSDTVRWSVR